MLYRERLILRGRGLGIFPSKEFIYQVFSCPIPRSCRKVKVEAAEGQLPDFDLGRKVGRKIFLQKDRRAVVLCVVDVWDFDGSLPRSALQ